MSSEPSQPRGNAQTRLPLRDSRRRYPPIVIASHLILHGYGHGLPNDPRGSGSDTLREDKLADLGPIHHGRKQVQPPRSELKQFHHAAQERLDFPTLWFDDSTRQAIGEAFARVVASLRYTVRACAVPRNHAHLCVRKHRDDPITTWRAFATNPPARSAGSRTSAPIIRSGLPARTRCFLARPTTAAGWLDIP